MKAMVATLLAAVVITVVPSLAQSPVDPATKAAIEPALVAVAQHLSPPYALYLYESLSRQILSNEQLMERLDSPKSPMAKDSLWALDIISQSILVEGQDGQYLDVRRVPPFFSDIAQRYLSPSHYWPEREITQDTRREQLATWYSIYVMLLVGNATQDEIAKTLGGGMFERAPEGLEPGGPSLVDRLHTEKILNDQAYSLVRIRRAGSGATEHLTFPSYVDEWKTKIALAYGVQ